MQVMLAASRQRADNRLAGVPHLFAEPVHASERQVRGKAQTITIDDVSCRVINLEEGRPTVNVGLLRLDHALAEAHADRVPLLKLIHGYGSSGVGGDLREQVWKALDVLQRSGQIAAFIPGEDFRESNAASWELVKRNKAIRNDRDYGRGNRGITIVVL
jgi:hypothetical protein